MARCKAITVNGNQCSFSAGVSGYCTKHLVRPQSDQLTTLEQLHDEIDGLAEIVERSPRAPHVLRRKHLPMSRVSPADYKASPDDYVVLFPDDPKRRAVVPRCEATRVRSTERCGKTALRGSRYCRFHDQNWRRSDYNLKGASRRQSMEELRVVERVMREYGWVR